MLNVMPKNEALTMIAKKFSPIKNNYWINELEQVKFIITNDPLTSKEIKDIKDQIIKLKSQGKKGWLLNFIIAFTIQDKNNAFDFIKSRRILKIDSYQNNGLTYYLVNKLLENKSKLGLTTSEEKYLQSKLDLCSLSQEVNKLQDKLSKKIKKESPSIIRDLLIIGDRLFFESMKELIAGRISKEEIGEAISYLIFIYHKYNKKLNINTFSHDADLNNPKYKEYIHQALFIKKFEEADTLIDNFEYNCSYKNCNLLVFPSDNDFERSRKYGYIHSDIQTLNFALSIIKDNKEGLSFDHLIDLFYKELKDKVIILKEKPISRYTVQLMELLELKATITQKDMFMDEYIEISSNAKENLLDINELLSFELYKSLTMWDLIIIKRIFSLLQGLLHRYLVEEVESRGQLDISYRSWLPVFTEHDIIKLIGYFIGEKKSKDFLLSHSWPTNNDKVLDVQYSPLINIGEMYYFPVNIFKASNLFRNALINNKIRPRDSEDDETSNLVYSELKKHFSDVEKTIKFNKAGFHGDFDVIAHIDGVVYVFECKNIINPAGLYELRGAYQNLKTGFSQLKKCRNALLDKNFLEYFNKKLNWKISDQPTIVTCLVLSTRMFNGYTDGVNHVRPIYELLQIIRTGEIFLNDGSKISLWNDNELTGNDIYQYIENRKLHSLIDQFMYEDSRNFHVADNKITFNTYQMDYVKFINKLKESFSKDSITSGSTTDAVTARDY